MNQLYLLRHGENKANLTKEFSYKLIDYPLTEKGRLQAHQTAQFLQGKDIQAIYSSPLKRACQTAEIIGETLNLSPTVSEAFRELNVGDLEKSPPTMETWNAYKTIITAWFKGNRNASFPNGENYHQTWSRYQQGLFEAVQTHPDQRLLIVGHGGIFTFTLPDLCPVVDFQNLIKMDNHNASLTRIDVTIENDRLIGTMIDWANISHLSGKAAELIPGFPQKGELK